jgi:hypothetical protein
MKRKILVVAVTVMTLVWMLASNVLPALAQRPSDAPPEPVCGWDWDRYLWNHYQYELWYYACDYGDGTGSIEALWNPDAGYLYPKE